MSLFGKILTIVNAVAALAFIYVAITSWGTRHQWAYAVYRHDLYLDGLPVDEKDADVDGRPLVANLDKQALDAIFRPAGGTPVKTQLEEVQRVRSGLATTGTPLEKLARVLLALKREVGRREALRVLAETKEEQLGTVVTETMFDTLIDPTAPPERKDAERKELLEKFKGADPESRKALLASELQKQLDRELEDLSTRNRPSTEKKLVIARLLFNLYRVLEPSAGEPAAGQPAADPLDAPWYKRFVTVVGVVNAGRTLDREAASLQQLSQEVLAAAEDDRGRFAAEHGRRVAQLQTAARGVDERKDLLRRQKATEAENKAVVDGRKAVEMELKERLDKAQQETQAAMARQAELETDLFKAQKELRDASDKNRKLEQDIRGLEQAR